MELARLEIAVMYIAARLQALTLTARRDATLENDLVILLINDGAKFD
jgi:hypothetical protein